MTVIFKNIYNFSQSAVLAIFCFKPEEENLVIYSDTLSQPRTHKAAAAAAGWKSRVINISIRSNVYNCSGVCVIYAERRKFNAKNLSSHYIRL
jgi:hypothetical protein